MFFKKLFKRKPKREVSKELPWIVEGKKVFGLHETRNKAELTAWLKSDGRRLGDTEKLPWCGDYAETAIKLGLPNELLLGDLGKNQYWARNWLTLGTNLQTPTYGAMLIFKRGSGGHVGFAVGEDDTCYYVLGGNQSNMVCISRIEKSRLLGARWPATYMNPYRPLPRMSPNGIPKTTNEF